MAVKRVKNTKGRGKRDIAKKREKPVVICTRKIPVRLRREGKWVVMVIVRISVQEKPTPNKPPSRRRRKKEGRDVECANLIMYCLRKNNLHVSSIKTKNHKEKNPLRGRRKTLEKRSSTMRAKPAARRPKIKIMRGGID